MKKQSSGFSLVEVLVAIVVLTVAFFPIITYFTNSIGFVSQSERLAQAHDIAVDSLELIKNGDFNDQSDINVINSNIQNSLSNNYDLFIEDYEIDLSLNYLDHDLNKLSSVAAGDVYLEDLRLVTILIRWNNDQNSYSLDSIIRIR